MIDSGNDFVSLRCKTNTWTNADWWQLGHQEYNSMRFYTKYKYVHKERGVWNGWSKMATTSTNIGSILVFINHFSLLFYTPIWKNGRIMPWRCSSVRPSFPDFFQHALEYPFLILYIHSLSSMAHRVWVLLQSGHFVPTLRLKVEQILFCFIFMASQIKKNP